MVCPLTLQFVYLYTMLNLIALSAKIQLNKIVSSPKSKETSRPMSIVKRSVKVYLFMKIVADSYFFLLHSPLRNSSVD